MYGQAIRIYGPYTRKDGRKIVILYDGVNRSARQLAKVKLEIHLGRLLRKGEEVDHEDEDKTNDHISNLRPITSTKNRQKANAIRYHGVYLD